MCINKHIFWIIRIQITRFIAYIMISLYLKGTIMINLYFDEIVIEISQNRSLFISLMGEILNCIKILKMTKLNKTNLP